MKRTTIVFLIAFALLPIRVAAQVTAERGGEEATIRQLEHDWETALVRGDQATINRIVAEDCVFISSTGEKMTKAEADVDRANSTVQLSTTPQMDIRIFGNVAVVVGMNIETSTYGGLNTSGRYRWTDVFVRRNGRWQVVSAQSTHVE
jgi:ketosteroid isomerase-like protein